MNNEAKVCCVVEPLSSRSSFREFQERIVQSKTKQDMLNACHAFIAFQGGFNNTGDGLGKEASRKIRGC